MAASGRVNIQQIEILRYFRSTAVLLLIAALLIVICLLVSVRVQKVTGTEFGVKINNMSGNIHIIQSPGTYIYNGIFNRFHILEKTVQKLQMTADASQGDRKDKDDLRVKAVDGSDIFLDLTVTYQIIPTEESIKKVILSSGLGGSYKHKWVRDYSRSICRTVFGELSPEQFYDAGMRWDKAQEASTELNTLLNPYGIRIERVIVDAYRFHPEYDEKIKAKTLAEQSKEQEVSKANAAVKEQGLKKMEANKAKDVVVAEYSGRMRQLIVEATAQAERVVTDAEAYAKKTTLGADAQFYKMQQNAEAIRATKKAEAEGLSQLAKALSGDGGRNIVKREYAKRLQEMTVTGQPFTVRGETERFVHTEEAGASKKRPAAK